MMQHQGMGVPSMPLLPHGGGLGGGNGGGPMYNNMRRNVYGQQVCVYILTAQSLSMNPPPVALSLSRPL